MHRIRKFILSRIMHVHRAWECNFKKWRKLGRKNLVMQCNVSIPLPINIRSWIKKLLHSFALNEGFFIIYFNGKIEKFVLFSILCEDSCEEIYFLNRTKICWLSKKFFHWNFTENLFILLSNWKTVNVFMSDAVY